MALLSDPNRATVWTEVMRLPQSEVGLWSITKSQVRSALNATDDWIESNLASFTAAVPAGVQAVASASQLLANVAAIARGSSVSDVSAGVADRSQSSVLLEAYNSASTWLTSNATSAITAAVTAGSASLTSAQALLLLQSVAQKRSEVANG